METLERSSQTVVSETILGNYPCLILLDVYRTSTSSGGCAFWSHGESFVMPSCIVLDPVHHLPADMHKACDSDICVASNQPTTKRNKRAIERKIIQCFRKLIMYTDKGFEAVDVKRE